MQVREEAAQPTFQAYGLGAGHKCPRRKVLWKRQQELVEAEMWLAVGPSHCD